MITSILNDALLLRNQPTEKLREYFQSINVTIFDAILSRASGNEDSGSISQEAKQTVLFILTAYSEDSPLVILRQGTKEEQEGICEYLNIPDYLRPRLVNLKDTEVRAAAIQYLRQFAGIEYKTLQFMKIQLEDLQMVILNRELLIEKEKDVKDGEGQTTQTVTTYYDYKEHSKAMTEIQRLSREIGKMEHDMRKNGRYLALEEIEEWKLHGKGKQIKTASTGLSIENSGLIRKQAIKPNE